MSKRLLPNNISNHFKFIMTQACEKTCGICRRSETITLPSGKSRTADNMLL